MKFRLDPLSVSGASAIPPIAPVITGVSASGGASPLTTKGDIYTYSTANDRLPVGGNGTVLSSDSTQATGLKWISAGGTGTVTTVSVVTANGVSGSVANATTTPAITLTLGAITPTTVNGLTISTTTGTLTVASAKTLTISNSLTLAGTDLTTMTFPGTSDTVVTLVAVQALTHKDLTDATNTFPTFNQNTTGSAAKWTTARNLAGNSVDGSANVAFANKFIVQGTTDAGLSNAQFMGALGTGIIKNTTTTGVFSIAIASDFPTLNQNTTGTAAGLSAVLVPASGGTGVANNNASTLTISGNFATTFTVNATTSLILPTTGTLATLAGAETLTNKILSDAFVGNSFQSQNALVENLTLGASTNYIYHNLLEVGASNALEIPATSTLEIEAYVDQALLNNAPMTATVESAIFQSLSATKQSIVLLPATNFQVADLVEIGVGYSLEIPQDSTLEIAAYGGGVINTEAAPPHMIGVVRLNAVETVDLFSGTALTAATWTDFKANQNFIVDNANSIVLVSLQGVAQITSTTTSTNVSSRVIVDSATSSLTYYVGGANALTANQAANPFAGNGFIMITGLLPGTHTIKTQVYSSGVNSVVFCRPSTQSNIEFFTTSIMEIKK